MTPPNHRERMSRLGRSTPRRAFLCRVSVVLLAFTLSSPGALLADAPLTPILGVVPSSLDFGTVPVDSIIDLRITLSNDADDPNSVLVVNSLTIGGDGFSLPTPPMLPLAIPGDSTTVPLVVRFQPPWPRIPSSAVDVRANNAVNPHSAVELEGEGELDYGDPSRIMGYDDDGIALICGYGLPDDPLPNTRGWECVPGVIPDNGTDSFVLEVDTKGPVTRVDVTGVFSRFVAPGSLQLRDDGLGGDRIANDFIFTSGAFRYNTSYPNPIGHYGSDPASPDGILFDTVASIIITELDMTTTQFALRPQVGCLRSNVPLAEVTNMSPTIAAAPHLVNIQSSAHATQRMLRHLDGDVRPLTNAIYDAFQDATDFFMFLSTNKVEVLPRTALVNAIAGTFWRAQINYSGTGYTPGDYTEQYGSHGRLLGIGCLDAASRGLYSQNTTHELLHQWGAGISPQLGLVTGEGHYLPESSVGSLIGGYRWIDNGNGTFTKDCTEGRNGAYHAALLDKYLMGLIWGTSVVPMHVTSELTPCDGLITPGQIARTTTITDIQAVHGVRVPGPLTAERDFTIAFVAESHERLLNAVEMTFYEILAEYYARSLPPEVPDPYHGGRAWVPVTRFFSESTTWRTDFPFLPPIAVPTTLGVPIPSTLERTAPNPLIGATDIRYSISNRAQVRLEIYDVSGRLVRNLVDAVQEPGRHTIRWDADDDRGGKVPSGTYYYRLRTGDQEASRSMVVVK